MSTNEYEDKAIEEVEEAEEVIDIDFEEDEQPVKEVKPTESLEARKSRLERQLAQTNKKLGLGSEKKEVQTSTPNDLGESAFLIANGLKDTDERALAKKLAKETGKDLESLLNTTYFQVELKGLREAKVTSNAIPNGSKRSNNSSVDTVEYWIAKGELPPTSDREMRQKVVNARLKKDETKTQFYNS